MTADRARRLIAKVQEPLLCGLRDFRRSDNERAYEISGGLREARQDLRGAESDPRSSIGCARPRREEPIEIAVIQRQDAGAADILSSPQPRDHWIEDQRTANLHHVRFRRPARTR